MVCVIKHIPKDFKDSLKLLLLRQPKESIKDWDQQVVSELCFENFDLEDMEFESAYSNTTMKQGNYEDTSSKAMLAIDGVGFD
ncbi:hypothetical protein Tco_0131189 [Tanacetum coccineum]